MRKRIFHGNESQSSCNYIFFGLIPFLSLGIPSSLGAANK